MEFSKKIHSKNERKGNHMAKLKKWIGNLKVAEKLSKCVLSLPMHPYMNEEQIEQISKAIIEIIK